jgi:hypothetical protein
MVSVVAVPDGTPPRNGVVVFDVCGTASGRSGVAVCANAGAAVRKQTNREKPAFKDNPFPPGDALDEKGMRLSVEWGSARASDQLADRCN